MPVGMPQDIVVLGPRLGLAQRIVGLPDEQVPLLVARVRSFVRMVEQRQGAVGRFNVRRRRVRREIEHLVTSGVATGNGKWGGGTISRQLLPHGSDTSPRVSNVAANNKYQ